MPRMLTIFKVVGTYFTAVICASLLFATSMLLQGLSFDLALELVLYPLVYAWLLVFWLGVLVPEGLVASSLLKDRYRLLRSVLGGLSGIAFLCLFAVFIYPRGPLRPLELGWESVLIGWPWLVLAFSFGAVTQAVWPTPEYNRHSNV